MLSNIVSTAGPDVPVPVEVNGPINTHVLPLNTKSWAEAVFHHKSPAIAPLGEVLDAIDVWIGFHTRSNAFVYFTKVVALHKATALGLPKPSAVVAAEDKVVTETVGKTTHVSRKKVVVNPVTMLNPVRKALKINEIDAFISQLPKTPSFMPV